MNSYPPEGGIPLDDSRRIIEEGEPAVPQEIPFWLTSPVQIIKIMRYLVKARVKPGREAELLQAIEAGTLGAGSVAGDEYLRNMEQARACSDGCARWVEICFCDLPLQRGTTLLGRVF